MVDEAENEVSYFVGLDLGRVGEFTGLAVVEQRAVTDKSGRATDKHAYSVRHLQRFPPGTPYNAVLDSVRQVFAEPGLKDGELVVDQTAVGCTIYEVFCQAECSYRIQAINVTGAKAAVRDDQGGWDIPKKDLVGVMQVLLQNRRLKVAPALEHAATLLRELQQFQLKTISPKCLAQCGDSQQADWVNSC